MKKLRIRSWQTVIQNEGDGPATQETIVTVNIGSDPDGDGIFEWSGDIDVPLDGLVPHTAENVAKAEAAITEMLKNKGRL